MSLTKITRSLFVLTITSVFALGMIVPITAEAAPKNTDPKPVSVKQERQDKVNTYGKCLDKFGKTKLSAIQKRAKNLNTERNTRLNKLAQKANKIKDDDAKKVALEGINSDRAALKEYSQAINNIKGDKEKANEEAVAAYCQMIFKLQIARNRTYQVYALIAADKSLKAEKSMQKLLASPTNLPTNAKIAKNPFKSDMQERLSTVKSLTDKNIADANTLMNEAKSAKMSELVGTGLEQDYKSSFKNPNKAITTLSTNRAQIWRNYNEVQVLKKAPNGFGDEYKDRLKLVAIEFKNKDGNTIKPDNTVVVKSTEVKKVEKEQTKETCKNESGKKKKGCEIKETAKKATKDRQEKGEKASSKPVYAYVAVKIGNSEDGVAFKKHSQHGAWIITRQIK